MDEAKSMSVSLTQVEQNIINRESERRGLNFSAALRLIVREWAELKEKSSGNPLPSDQNNS